MASMTKTPQMDLPIDLPSSSKSPAALGIQLTAEDREKLGSLTTEDIEERPDIDRIRAVADDLVRQAMAIASPRKRLEMILDTPGLELVAPLLPAEQLFFTMQQVGLADSVELLHVCSPEQFKAFIDLDSWDGDDFVPEKALAWIRAAGTDENVERFDHKFDDLDIEVTELLLRAKLKIWDLEEDDDPEVEGEVFRVPGDKYLLEYACEDDELPAVKRIIDSLFVRDAFRASRLIEAVRWELTTELTESAYRWRAARLADLGFPDMEEAVSYFAYVDPKAAIPAARRAAPLPPAFALSRPSRRDGILKASMDLMDEEARSQLEGQMVALLNAVLVMEKTPPGDTDAVEATLRRARDTLSLGLERASGADAARGAEILRTASLKRLFQLGVSMALKLKFRLDRLARTGDLAIPGMAETMLDEPYASLFKALRRRPPQSIACDDVPASPLGVKPVPFRSLRNEDDLLAASRGVDEIERIHDLMKGIGLNPGAVRETLCRQGMESALPFVRWSDLLVTAVARESVGEGFAFEPLPRRRLEPFAAEAFERHLDGHVSLKPGFRELLTSHLRNLAVDLSDDHVRTAMGYSEKCLKRLFEEMASAWESGTLDSVTGQIPVIVGD